MWDNNPDTMARVGEILAHQYRVTAVDINFGCPVRQVTERARSGSYLLNNPEHVGRIVERVVRACAPTPVTAKIRLGCTRDRITARDVVQAIEGAGGAAVTVHGRTAQDFFKGQADWERIAELKPHLKQIPLIGNGDLSRAEDVPGVFKRDAVDGVMIARACLGRPWIFRQAAAALAGKPIPPDPTPRAQQACLQRHFALVLERFGEHKGVVLMRKYACCYAQARRGARGFRRAISNAPDAATFWNLLDTQFPGVAAGAGCA